MPQLMGTQTSCKWQEYASQAIAILPQLTAIVTEKGREGEREKGSSAKMHNECLGKKDYNLSCNSLQAGYRESG